MEYRTIRPEDDDYKNYVSPEVISQKNIEQLVTGIEAYLLERLKTKIFTFTMDEARAAFAALEQKFRNRDYAYEVQEIVTDIPGGTVPLDSGDFETEHEIVEDPVNEDTSHEFSCLYDSNVIMNNKVNYNGGTLIHSIPVDLIPLNIHAIIVQNDDLNLDKNDFE
jgi:hypothetical protein